MPRDRRIFLLMPTLLLAGCAAGPRAGPGGGPSVVTTLYFGLGRADGSVVGEADWKAFVEAVIVRRFPDGFTVLAGDGTWASGGKTQHEPSRVVVIVRPDTPAVDAAIDAIRTAYCRQFRQESVLRVDETARHVSF